MDGSPTVTPEGRSRDATPAASRERPLRFAVNLSLLFTELPLLRRPAAAAAAGFEAVELWWPFDEPSPPAATVDALANAVEHAGVRLGALNLYAGDLAAGDRGVLSYPERAAEFSASVPVAVELAGRLGCTVLHALYGKRREGLARQTQDGLAVEQLAAAAEAAARVGATVVVEAMNPKEQPDFPLHSTAQALACIERVRARTGAALGLLYDVYHMQRAEGDLIATIREYGSGFTHVQIADAPDRTPPGTGEIAFPRVLRALADSGYQGLVGLEYRPVGASVDSFGWTETVCGRGHQ